MTCIVSFLDKENGIGYIGGDSFGSTTYSGQVYKNKKVFKSKDTKDIVIGYTNSFRMGDLLEYTPNLFDKLDIFEGKEINREYLVTKFIPKISSVFAQGKFEACRNGEASGGEFILTTKNAIYTIQKDYSVLESSTDYASVGSGSYFALGSLYSTNNIKDLTPVDKIKMALEAAEFNQMNVRRPFYIINTNNDEVVIIY